MDEINIDPTLLGVIVGSVLSLFGNFVGQWFTLRREESNWKRQRDADKEDSALLRENQEIEKITEIYENCLTNLAAIESFNDNNLKPDQEEYKELYQKTVNWVTKLKLHLRDEYCNERSDFKKWVDHFIQSPDHWAEELLKEINKQMISDKILYPNSKVNVKTVKSEDFRKVQFSISDDFRKKEMIRGVSLQKTHLLDTDLKEFTERQRELIWDIHTSGIPEHIVLYMPKFIEGQNKINYKAAQWEGRVNPKSSSIQTIVEIWENEYRRQLEKESNQISNS